MPLNPKIIVVGDVHLDFGAFNKLISRKHPEIVLQCGDFGYWPRITAKELYGRENPKYPKDLPCPKVPKETKVFWCDGNHEDHQELGLRTTDELWPRVYYMPRGSVLALPDGRRVMFFGGAESVDKAQRKEGIDWFPDEIIRYSQIANLDYDGKIDVVISHTCPVEFDIQGSLYWSLSRIADCSRQALSHILHRYNPPLWYFGHWHRYATGYTAGCRWTALNYAGQSGWWEELRS